MKALVVYESMFGNTHLIADAVAEGLQSAGSAGVCRAHDVTAALLEGVDLVVVGSPTHAWSLPSHRTRIGAVQDVDKHPDHQLAPGATESGVREWLESLPPDVGVCAGIFDTRINKPKVLTGTATRSLSRKVRQHGFELIADPESFVVVDTDGPLVDGEIERARNWGMALTSALQRHLDSVEAAQASVP
jgi:Flavodoxin domain